MIEKEFIKQKTTEYQTTEMNVAREYIQNLFLSSFYKQKETEKVLFKGGTALRIIYDSPRFSEDLDFTGLISRSKVESLFLTTVDSLKQRDITAELTESKHTSGGFLGILSVNSYDLNIEIKVEVSLREEDAKSEIMTIANDFIPAYTITALAQEEIVAEKLQAVFERNQPRDWYDLYFLLRSRLVPVEERGVLKDALEKLRQTDISFKKLKLLLPQDHQQILQDFEGNLIRELERFVN